jgi:hypothetical protein
MTLDHLKLSNLDSNINMETLKSTALLSGDQQNSVIQSPKM